MDDFRTVRCMMRGAHAVEARSHRRFARHSHDEFGIGVVEHGGQLSHSGRGEVEAGPGDAITVNPGELHDGAPVGDRGRAWRILYLEPGVVAEAAHDIALDRSATFEFARPVVCDPRVGRTVLALFRAATTDLPPMRRDELLLAAVAALGEATERIVERLLPPIARARALVDDDPTAPLTLADLATVGGLSRYQLVRGFTRDLGMTPHAYLVQRRISLARRLIRGGMPLAAAAAASGFSDQSHMTRTFTSRYGVTPRAFADAVR